MTDHPAAFNTAGFIFINRKDTGSKAFTLSSRMTENSFIFFEVTM